MKRLLLLISFTFLFLFSFTQTDVQRDIRVNPILKQALAAKSGYYIYGRNGTAGFINIAVLNRSSHTITWFTCHGRLFDSTKLTIQEFEKVTSKQLDPFVLYQNICDKYLADIAAAKDIYRVIGDIQLFDKLNGTYRALFAMETVQAAKTRLQKLIAIENVRKKILTQLAYINCASPFGLHNDPLYKISKEQAGAMIQTKDSTVYYNIDPTSAVAKISLFKKSAGQLYIQNRFSEIIDSVALQPGKYDLLQKEKTDVFLLYRGWLEMQWQGVFSAIRRQSVGLYNQVGEQNEESGETLYSQLNAISTKINQLNSPEAKSIEQAVYDTYKNETSEINYIPLLGIGYSLTQTRGQKEYELTNHLGNVLATVSDKKIGVSSSSNSSLIDHYEPDIVSAQDYYPFGMLQPGRSYLSPNGEKYRYGFNGKENDSEVKGEGNQQDYGMRVYDNRVGRFLSVDPLTKLYPWLSSYQYSENSPIANVDLDGLESAYAADGSVVNGPWQSNPNTGGRLYSAPPPNTFAYVLDQSKKAIQKPAAQPKLVTQDILKTPTQVKQAVARTTGGVNLTAIDDHMKKYGYDVRIPMIGKLGPQATVDKPRPDYGYTDFEYGMITNPMTQASVMTLCPGCTMTYGAMQINSGIQTGNKGEILEGALNVVAGAATLYYKSLPEINVGDKVSTQLQARHLPGNSKGYLNVMNSAEEAQKVVDAFKSGKAKVVDFHNMGKAGGGVTQIEVEFEGVTGMFYSKDLSTGQYIGVPTNRFRIEGASGVKVFPVNPTPGK